MKNRNVTATVTVVLALMLMGVILTRLMPAQTNVEPEAPPIAAPEPAGNEVPAEVEQEVDDVMVGTVAENAVNDDNATATENTAEPMLEKRWSGTTDITALLAENGYWYYGRDPVLPRVGESEDDVADCRWVAYTDGTNVIRMLDNATDMMFGVACDHAGIWEMYFSPMFVPGNFDVAIKVEGKEYRTYEDLMVVLTEFLEYDDCDELTEGETFVEPSYWSEWAKWGVGPTPLGEAF